MRLLDEWAERLDNLGPVAQRVGRRADDVACQALDRLRSIDEGVRNLYSGADAYSYPRLVVDAGGEIIDGRQGYSSVIENIAVVASGAADVDLFVMSDDAAGFVHRFSLGAAGRDNEKLSIPVPEGVPIIVRSSLAGVNVNLILKRVRQG